jgi:hypothetical protein
MNHVSNLPMRRSAIRLESGSRGGKRSSFVGRVPMNASLPAASTKLLDQCP